MLFISRVMLLNASIHGPIDRRQDLRKKQGIATVVRSSILATKTKSDGEKKEGSDRERKR